MTGIELRGVSVALDGRPVLRDLDLIVPGGSRVALIGPNGSGKTTLLRAIAGLVPARGRIRVGDAPPHSLSRRELARRIAVVPQSPAVPAGMTVTDLRGPAPADCTTSVATELDHARFWDLVLDALTRIGDGGAAP